MTYTAARLAISRGSIARLDLVTVVAGAVAVAVAPAVAPVVDIWGIGGNSGI
jgi:hypothetical protein